MWGHGPKRLVKGHTLFYATAFLKQKRTLNWATAPYSTGSHLLRTLPDKTSIRVNAQLSCSNDSQRLFTCPPAFICEPERRENQCVYICFDTRGIQQCAWAQSPQNVLIVKKRGDDRVANSVRDIILHIQSRYPALNIIVEDYVWEQMGSQFPTLVPFQESTYDHS